MATQNSMVNQVEWGNYILWRRHRELKGVEQHSEGKQDDWNLSGYSN